MKLLITGAGGMLGGRLAELLGRKHDVVAATRTKQPPDGLSEVRLDLGSAPIVQAALDAREPDAVVHCAALADADACERQPDLAERENVTVPRLLASLCREAGIRMIALSTDLVLSGRDAWSDEICVPEPRLVYGDTKWRGERAVLESDSTFAVFRVALVYGRGFGRRATASETILGALNHRRSVRLFTDQYRTMIDPESVADALERALVRRSSGLFHLGGPERLSRYEFGLRVARTLGLDGRQLLPARQADRQPNPRPADASLDSSRARRELSWTPRPVDDGIRESRFERELTGD